MTDGVRGVLFHVRVWVFWLHLELRYSWTHIGTRWVTTYMKLGAWPRKSEVTSWGDVSWVWLHAG